jgi:thiamine kinase-like enzyme
MNINEAIKYLKTIPIFSEKVIIERLEGGISNYSFLINCNNKKFVAKFLNDLMHFNTTHLQEVEANKAAHKLGIAPKIIFYNDNVIVFEYIPHKVLTIEDVKKEKTLKQIVFLLKIVHKKVHNYFRGPAMICWNFHSVIDYIRTLKKINSPYIEKLSNFVKDIKIFEDISSPFEIVFTHGDLYLPNILNTGKELQLIDWEYAGFNSPLNDLSSIAKHAKLNQEEEKFLLNQYYEIPITLKLMQKLQAMKCASILKEALWSMIAEIKPPIDYDFRQYTKEKLDQYRRETEKLFNN